MSQGSSGAQSPSEGDSLGAALDFALEDLDFNLFGLGASFESFVVLDLEAASEFTSGEEPDVDLVGASRASVASCEVREELYVDLIGAPCQRCTASFDSFVVLEELELEELEELELEVLKLEELELEELELEELEAPDPEAAPAKLLWEAQGPSEGGSLGDELGKRVLALGELDFDLFSLLRASFEGPVASCAS